MNPLKAYVGKRVELGHASVEIRGQRVRGRRTWLVGHDVATGEERLISMRAFRRRVLEK